MSNTRRSRCRVRDAIGPQLQSFFRSARKTNLGSQSSQIERLYLKPYLRFLIQQPRRYSIFWYFGPLGKGCCTVFLATALEPNFSELALSAALRDWDEVYARAVAERELRLLIGTPL